jgi:hypothetical protein
MAPFTRPLGGGPRCAQAPPVSRVTTQLGRCSFIEFNHLLHWSSGWRNPCQEVRVGDVATMPITRQVDDAFQRVELDRRDAVIADDVLINSPAGYGIQGREALKSWASASLELAKRVDLVDGHIALDAGNGQGVITFNFTGSTPTTSSASPRRVAGALRWKPCCSWSATVRSSGSTSRTTCAIWCCTPGIATGRIPTTSPPSRSLWASIPTNDWNPGHSPERGAHHHLPPL